MSLDPCERREVNMNVIVKASVVRYTQDNTEFSVWECPELKQIVEHVAQIPGVISAAIDNPVASYADARPPSTCSIQQRRPLD